MKKKKCFQCGIDMKEVDCFVNYREFCSYGCAKEAVRTFKVNLNKSKVEHNEL